jgi:uracil-DNA glycosylase
MTSFAGNAGSGAELIERLAGARIGSTYNQYRHSPLCRERLERYLEARAGAAFVLVGEAAGYRGARVSGIPFTSERQLTGRGPAEATATIVHRALSELGVEEDVLLWNVVPTHPGTEISNRRPTRDEVEAGLPFLADLADGRSVIAIGRVAQEVLRTPYLRHPSHGGARAFRSGLEAALQVTATESNSRSA